MKVKVKLTAVFEIETIDNISMEDITKSIKEQAITPLNKKLWSGILDNIKCTGLEKQD